MLRTIGIACALFVCATGTVLAAGQTVTVGNLKFTVSPPQGWSPLEGQTGFWDASGNKGSIAILATPMPVADSMGATMNKAAYDQSQQRIKLGQVKSVEWKPVSKLKGVLLVESDKDPSFQRLQWICNGRGHYINITCASQPAHFAAYEPIFRAFVNSMTIAP